MHADSIGRRLKVLREQRGLTRRALAMLAEVSESTLCMVETGFRRGEGLRLGTAKRICGALGIGLDALVGPLQEARQGAAPKSPFGAPAAAEV